MVFSHNQDNGDELTLEELKARVDSEVPATLQPRIVARFLGVDGFNEFMKQYHDHKKRHVGARKSYINSFGEDGEVTKEMARDYRRVATGRMSVAEFGR